jgi:hypothetical protein
MSQLTRLLPAAAAPTRRPVDVEVVLEDTNEGMFHRNSAILNVIATDV